METIKKTEIVIIAEDTYSDKYVFLTVTKDTDYKLYLSKTDLNKSYKVEAGIPYETDRIWKWSLEDTLDFYLSTISEEDINRVKQLLPYSVTLLTLDEITKAWLKIYEMKKAFHKIPLGYVSKYGTKLRVAQATLECMKFCMTNWKRYPFWRILQEIQYMRINKPLRPLIEDYIRKVGKEEVCLVNL